MATTFLLFAAIGLLVGVMFGIVLFIDGCARWGWGWWRDDG
jgi:hypothetical protein